MAYQGISPKPEDTWDDNTHALNLMYQSTAVEKFTVVITRPIEINSSYTSIVIDPLIYDISSALVVMPAGGTIRYSVSMIREDENGYTIFYSSTVLDSTYNLKYTLVQK